jgi:RNA polymerase sigma-70 factor (ECF subfamily)
VDNPSADLVARWRLGDQRAAEELVGRYTERLLALARTHLSAKLAARVDPEDVLQSAYRSFFAAAREDRFVLERSGDLWRLLSAITLHKLHRQVDRQQAAKRSVAQEQPPPGAGRPLRLEDQFVAGEPSPPDVLAAAEELEFLMRPLPPHHRRMVELRLQGHRFEEVAAATDRSERFVRKVLAEFKARLLDRRRALEAP